MSSEFRVVTDLDGGAGSNGGGGIYQLTGVFPDDTARDNFFKLPANRKSLTNGVTAIVTGSTMQQWRGENAPRVYDAAKWASANVALRGDAQDILSANVKPGSILTIDPTGKLIVASGATVTADGSLVTGSPNSFYLAESHRISSAGSHVAVTNLATNETFFSVQVPDNATGDAVARFPYFLSSDPQLLVIGKNTGVVTNPHTSYIPAGNLRVYRIDFLPVNTITGVRMSAQVNGRVAWDTSVGNFTAGQPASIDLQATGDMLDLHINQVYTLRLYSKAGDVRVSGDVTTGQPLITVHYREYDWQRVETEHTRLQAITVAPDYLATFDFADGREIRLNARQWFAKVAIDGITSEVDPAKKSVTLNLTSGGTVVATGTIDLSQMASGGNPSTLPVNVYYGFIDTRRADMAAVKAGAVLSTRSVSNLRLTYQRADTTSDYLFFWAPNSLGAITGFAFDGTFMDQWASVNVTIDGVPGKVYVSDNPTTARTVNIEVKV